MLYNGILYVFDNKRNIFIASSVTNNFNISNKIGQAKADEIEFKNIAYSFNIVKNKNKDSYKKNSKNLLIFSKKIYDNFVDYTFGTIIVIVFAKLYILVSIFDKHTYLQNVEIAKVFNIAFLPLSFICGWIVAFFAYKLLNIEYSNQNTIESMNYIQIYFMRYVIKIVF